MSNAEAAEIFITAIKTIADKPDNLSNLEGYLSYHFETWLKKMGKQPRKHSRRIKKLC